MNDFNIIERGNIPKDYWFLLQYAVMGDFERLEKIVKRINKEGKTLVALKCYVLPSGYFSKIPITPDQAV